jgi:hypothetical protein
MIHIASTHAGMIEALGLPAAVRAEAWSIRMDQCHDHAEIMAAWADAWDAWNRASKRGAVNTTHRDAVLIAEAARMQSLHRLAAVVPQEAATGQSVSIGETLCLSQ